MALDPVPWFVGGGAEHSPDVARQVAYASTGGGEGVLGPADFKVTELDVPGTSVRVAAGSAALLNRYLSEDADFGKQSYIPRAESVTDVPVTATGSTGGRSDLVVVRIDDPQFGGQAPADPVVGPYNRFEIIENVPAATVSAAELNLGYPALALARLDIPLSTGTIDNSMITDLREIAQPKTKRRMATAKQSGGPSAGAVNALTSSTYVKWPSQAQWTFEVPKWATHVVIRGDVTGYVVKQGSCTGTIQVKLGTVVGTDTGSYDENYASASGPYRNSLTVVDTLAIPVAMRGTTQTLTIQGRRSQNTGYIDADTYTQTLFDVEFQERVL